MRSLVVAVVLGLAAVASAEPDRVVRGVVIDEKTRAPIEGALVTGQVETATTDQDGNFAIVVTSSEQHLVVSAPGYAMRSTPVASAQRVELVESHEVIVVQGTAPRARPRKPPPPPPPPPERPAAQSYQLSAAELRILPGTANDALRAAQVLPGVARLPYSFGGLVMRGTSPRDNAVYLDGVEVPIAFHFGGISSFYPSSMLDGLTVTNGGIPAEYGRAQGGIIEMTSREPRGDRWRTGGSVGLLDTSLVAEGPYHGGAVLLGFRRSYLDIVLTPFVADDTPLPSYYDAQLKASFGRPERPGGRISPMLFLSLDYLTAVTQKPDREDESSVTSFFVRAAVMYERRWGPLSLRLVPWLGTNQLHFTSRVGTVIEKFKRPSYPFGVRAALARELTWGDMRTGVDLQGGHLTHFQAGLGHKNDILHQVNGETSIDWVDLALWWEARFELGRLDVAPGVRLERYGLSHETVLDPRVSLTLPLTSSVTLRESVGRYHQPPTPGDIDPNGGNPQLDSSYYDSFTLGLEGELGAWAGSLTGFYSDGQRLGMRTESSPAFESLGSLGPTFAQLLEKQLGLAFHRQNIGRAKNYGIELLAKRATKRWFGLVSYTLAKAVRTIEPHIATGWKPFALDQRHSLNLAGSVALTNWRLGARIQLVSGTPFELPQVIDPVLNLQNERLPTFFQIDLRADRTWQRCWGTIGLYFDIQNVTNRRNVEGRDIDEFGAVTDIRGLPLLPFIGLEFTPH